MKPAGSISARWKKITQSLTEVGINADTVSINSRFSATQFPVAPMLPLRQVLQEAADFYALYKPPTPYERAEQSKAAQAAAKKTLTLLQRLSAGGRNYPDYAQVHFYQERDRQLCDLLAWKIAELQERGKTLRTAGSSSKQNARNKMQHDHWHALADVWLDITMIARSEPSVSKYRRKHLGRFLLACTDGPAREIKNFARNFLATDTAKRR
jgi:hypothetical protein